MMSSKLEKYNMVLVMLFFCHGFLYFYSGDIYNPDNPVKLLKYFLIIAIFIFSFKFIELKPDNIFILSTFLLYLIFTALYYILNNTQIFSVITFLIPVLFFLLPGAFKYENLLRLMRFIIYLATLFSVLEILFFDEISERFNSTGFRSISIFVNPNNFAVVICLALSLLTGSKNSIYTKSRLWVWICSSVSVILSGSMTGVVIILFLFALNIIDLVSLKVKATKYYRFIALSIIGLVSIITMVYLVDMDKYLRSADSVGMDNVTARFDYLTRFITNVADNIFYPLIAHPDLYADNAFVYTWINLGFFGFVLYISFSLLLIYLSIFNNSKKAFTQFMLCIFLASVTTNILNIWPVAYLYWLVAGFICNKKSNERSSDKVQLES
ncbi:hypothetical protein AAH446_10230 [Erwinia sp. P6884]|uniref:hypothetical protein n=1 Tax=Erwinia sp. P6884 TaxID=3141450 RepID=UPI003191CCC9